MGLFGKLFGGGGSSLEGLRKAVAQKRFSEARLLAEELASQSLSDAEAAEVEQLRITAGDGLAELNLDEALGLQRCGHFEQAAEHLCLAQEQVCSPALRDKIVTALAAEPLIPEIASAEEQRLEACNTCSPLTHQLVNAEDALSGDAETQLELVLTSYPADLAKRYAAKGDLFKEAFLFSHAGEDEQALPLWQQVDEAEQDDLYWFELGSLLARQGDFEEAQVALEQALAENPELLLAIEALVPVLLTGGDYPLVEERLQSFLAQGIDPAFCYAQLTSLAAQQQDFSSAATHAREAITAGSIDREFLLLAAAVLEQVGALDDAENILQMLPVSGCGGGTSLPLAEFWLRQNRELDRILETFNAACREDPEDPRWQLRVAQTYLAKNWHKDGLKLLRMVVADPRLEPELAEEARQLLETQQG